MKKLLIGIVALAALALTAAPAAAYMPGFPMPSNDVNVSNFNSAYVSNNVSGAANTGANSIMGGGLIMTGSALASGYAENTVNSNVTSVYAPCRNCNGDVTVSNYNSAVVTNTVAGAANTGANTIMSQGRPGPCGGGSGSGMIITGAANAYGETVNVVNSNVTRIMR